MLGKLSIVPVVITGSRAKLPADSWLPRPGPLTVEFCPGIATADFGDELSLVRETRRAILERLGEPDLDAALPAEPEPAAAEVRT